MNMKVADVFMKDFRYLAGVLKTLEKENYLKYKWMILSGSRKAGKTYAILNFMLLLSMMLSRKKEKSAIVIVRHQSNQLKDTWKQWNHQKERLLLNTFFQANQTDRVQWTINGKVDIFFRSVYSPSGDMAVKGLPRLNYDKAFVMFDESDQMTQGEIDAMLEAVEAQEVMPIWLFNPNSDDEWIVGRANRLVPEDEDIMIKGSGSHFTEIKNEVGQQGIIHRVNYKVNKYLSEDEIDRFKLQAKINPKRARTAVYGLTGNAGDRSYMSFDKKKNVIKQEEDFQFFEKRKRQVSDYVLGTDFGTTIGHDTAAVLDIFYNNNKYGTTAREWGWENDSTEGVPFYQIEEQFIEKYNINRRQLNTPKGQQALTKFVERMIKNGINVYKDNERLAYELVNQVEEWASLKQFSNMKQVGLKIKVDPGGGGKSFKMSIEKEIAKRGLTSWVKVRTAKKAKVDFRQQFGDDLLAANWKISSFCPHLIKEIMMAKNDEKLKEKGIIQREKRNDNYLDPWDYAKEAKYKRLTKGSAMITSSDFGVYHNG